MIHLGSLPGAPLHADDFASVLEAAERDARLLAAAGFDALLVENFGDVPFHADRVPATTVAAMAIAVRAVRDISGLQVGVNVLRNDAMAALAIAAATGAEFIRVNVLTGTMYTDQGPIVGRADEVMRLRRDIAPQTLVLADVFVKHATPPPGLAIEHAAEDTVRRGLADALVVSGSGTGKPPSLTAIRKVKAAVRGTPVLLGSGVTAATARKFLDVADGIIAGTTLKQRGVAANAVAPKRAAAFIRAARRKRTR